MNDRVLESLDSAADGMSASEALAQAEIAIREAEQLAASATVSPIAVREHLQNLAASFFTERIKNASSLEAVRAKAAQMLLGKIDEETSPTQLMRILESVSELNGVDFQAILTSMQSTARPGQPVGTTNIFMSAPQQGGGQVPPGITTDSMKVLDALVGVAETVVSAHGRDADPREVARALAERDGLTDIEYDNDNVDD